MYVEAVEVRALRNLGSLNLSPSPGFNVFSVENGQGKTNLLEALYLVGTLRSFRTSRLSDLIRTGEARATVEARVSRHGLARVYQVILGPRGRLARLDGKLPRALGNYFGGFNVVLFAPEDLRVPRSSPADRRR